MRFESEYISKCLHSVVLFLSDDCRIALMQSPFVAWIVFHSFLSLFIALFFFLFSTELWKRNYKQSWVPFKANSNSSHWMNKRAVSENNSMAFLPSWLVSCSDDETVHLIHWRGSEEINCQFSVNFWFWQLEEWTSEIDSCNCTPQEAFRVNKQLFFHKSQLYFVKKLQANNYLVRNPPAIASQSSAPACNVTPSFYFLWVSSRHDSENCN